MREGEGEKKEKKPLYVSREKGKKGKREKGKKGDRTGVNEGGGGKGCGYPTRDNSTGLLTAESKQVLEGTRSEADVEGSWWRGERYSNQYLL